MSDFIERLISQKHGLRVVWLDVSETAKELEQRHLSGPAAGQVLGQAIVATALLSTKLKSEDEKISFQLKTDGPLKGVLVDVSTDGALRGYTDVKIIDELDADTEASPDKTLGTTGHLTIIHSNNKKVLSSGTISLSPPEIRKLTARYFNQSEQIPTGVEIYTGMRDFGVEMARGIMVQKMPGADRSKFVEILERFESKKVLSHLSELKTWEDLKSLLALDDLKSLEKGELRFSCPCSYEKSANILGTLSIVELRELVRAGKGQPVVCHFCGESYRVRSEDIERTLLNKAGPEFNA